MYPQSRNASRLRRPRAEESTYAFFLNGQFIESAAAAKKKALVENFCKRNNLNCQW